MPSILISPSGNLYGSELVLLDYLKHTKLKFKIYVPKNSKLFSKLINDDLVENVFTFNPNNLTKFYFIWLLSTLLINKHKTIYINEGGHIRYIKILSKIFKRLKFIIHVRTIYDASHERLGNMSKNITLLTVSKYVQAIIQKENSDCIQLYDPYSFILNKKTQRLKSIINIGIVGRVCESKGISHINELINSRTFQSSDLPLHFHFFGEVIEEVNTNKIVASIKSSKVQTSFHGYKEKSIIFETIDILLHMNQHEALGRVILEALDYGNYVICPQKGGSGELANLFQISTTFNLSDINWHQIIYTNIVHIWEQKSTQLQESFVKNFELNKMIFDPEKYAYTIDNVIEDEQ